MLYYYKIMLDINIVMIKTLKKYKTLNYLIMLSCFIWDKKNTYFIAIFKINFRFLR